MCAMFILCELPWAHPIQFPRVTFPTTTHTNKKPTPACGHLIKFTSKRNDSNDSNAGNDGDDSFAASPANIMFMSWAPPPAEQRCAQQQQQCATRAR